MTRWEAGWGTLWVGVKYKQSEAGRSDQRSLIILCWIPRLIEQIHVWEGRVWVSRRVLDRVGAFISCKAGEDLSKWPETGCRKWSWCFSGMLQVYSADRSLVFPPAHMFLRDWKKNRELEEWGRCSFHGESWSILLCDLAGKNADDTLVYFNDFCFPFQLNLSTEDLILPLLIKILSVGCSACRISPNQCFVL